MTIRRRNQRGNSMVQFSIAASILFSMVFFIIEFGQATWRYNTVAGLAKDAVRYASVHGSTSGSVADSAMIQTYVNGKNAGFPVIVRTTWPDGNKDQNSKVQVQVQASFSPLAATPRSTLTLRSTAQAYIAR